MRASQVWLSEKSGRSEEATGDPGNKSDGAEQAPSREDAEISRRPNTLAADALFAALKSLGPSPGGSAVETRVSDSPAASEVSRHVPQPARDEAVGDPGPDTSGRDLFFAKLGREEQAAPLPADTAATEGESLATMPFSGAILPAGSNEAPGDGRAYGTVSLVVLAPLALDHLRPRRQRRQHGVKFSAKERQDGHEPRP